ncbi:MAG: glycosyltransferase family 4 protein, partial [Nocardioides sp.]
MVEVYCDGVSAGPARTGLAGTFAGAGGGPGSGLDMFEVSVRVPQGRDRVELTGVGHPCVGEPFALRPWSAQVEPQKPKEWSAAREALVRSRNADRLTALRAALRFATTDAVVPGRLPRVLVVTHDLGLGGGQLYLQELVRRLHRRGLTLSVVSLRGGRLVDELEELGIPVLVTGAADVHDPEAYESHVLQLASWAVEHGSEAALVNTMSAFSGADAAHRIRLPIVWAIHESYPFSQYWTEAHGPGVHPRVVERGAESLAAARCVVFEAEATHRLYVPSIRDGAGVVVPYGVDLSEIADYQRTSDRAAVRRELGFSESTRVLLCMGTVEPRKAQVSLVQAFAGSDRLAGADVRLVFVGGRDGEPYDDVLREAIESYADDRIMLEPVQPHIERWYLAADVLVCASDVESLPRSMLEVMAFGRPIASTSVFGIPELVDDGVTGFLCESRDLLELRRMLERVCGTSADELTALGAAAREVVLRRHDPMIFEEFYLERLTTLAADNELEPSGRL